MVILSTDKFNEICDYIRGHKGLWVECEDSLKDRFPGIDPLTLGSIFLTLKQNWMKNRHFIIKTPTSKSKSKQSLDTSGPKTGLHSEDLLKQFESLARLEPSNGTHVLRMAQRLKFSPRGLARKLLVTKFPNLNKQEITELIRNEDLIPDPALALNVSFCSYNDSLESGLVDMSRRCIGEEFEVKLKELSRAAGLVFYDEGDLRREGFDKTPDLKLAVPFMYRGKVVNWIESKALFGDLGSHRDITKKQLQSYSNRFGHGIVIYWFGYQDQVGDFENNGEFVTVLDHFPETEEIELLRIQ